jgi:hypothetical protein
LNENQEKLTSDEPVIGRFGVGLKDALATFHRRGVEILIRSSHGEFALREASKHNFEGITTLHVERTDGDSELGGTEVILKGVEDEAIAEAMAMFLRFSDDQVIEQTRFGEVIHPGTGSPKVFISGVVASEEPDFLFSYNVTDLTQTMKKQLNRERLNVGRTTYAGRVKDILKVAESEAVHEALIEQVGQRASGRQCDEMAWADVSQRALLLQHEAAPVTFVTESELEMSRDAIDHMRGDGMGVVVVTEAQRRKLEDSDKSDELMTLSNYIAAYNESFEFEIVERGELRESEKAVFALAPRIAQVAGVDPDQLPPIKISETMRADTTSTLAVWDPREGEIILKRSLLSSTKDFAGALLHEVAHALSGAEDVSREFEAALTELLAEAAVSAISE